MPMAISALLKASGRTETQVPISFRRHVKRLAQGFVYWSGIEGCMPRRSSAVVLMYHSVEMPEASKYIDPAWSMTLKCFERQIRFLARRRHVIPLSELVELLKNGREPKPGSVVLTFDDGYKDNFYVVAPILRHYGLPATISLATDYVTSGENQPIDRLYAIFRTHTRARIKLPFSDGVEVNTIYDLRQPSHWKLAYQICAQQLSQSTR